MRNVDILFFDKPYLNLLRFGNEIAGHIRALDSTISIGGMFCIDAPSSSDEYAKTNFDSVYIRKDVKAIDEFLISNEVKVIVFTIYRVCDMEVILHAKHLGIKTIMLQEGVIFDGTNIDGVTWKNILASFAFLPKVVWYLRTLKDMCKYDSQSYKRLIFGMRKVKTKLPIYIMKSFSVPLICDYVFIMGEHWREYFKTVQGYGDDKILLMGDHDMDGMDLSVKPEKAVCYVANVLVEDGTIQKDSFLEFVSTLADLLKDAPKVYVKLHPRSDESLFGALKSIDAIFLRSESLPYCAAYIGHRSTLLGRALYITDNLILWRFPSEKVCFYENYATAVCSSRDEIAKAVGSIDYENVSNYKRARVSEMYLFVPDGSFHQVAQGIVSYLENDAIDINLACSASDYNYLKEESVI